MSKGELKEEFTEPIEGVDLSFIWYPKKEIPVQIGWEFEYSEYGMTTFNKDYGTYWFDRSLNVKTKNKLLAQQLVLRVIPDRNRITPFAEMILGLNHFHTVSVLKEQQTVFEWFDTEQRPRYRNLDSFAPRFGLKGGFQITLWKSDDWHDNMNALSLYVKAGYILGGQADYLKEGDLALDSEGLTGNYSPFKFGSDWC